MTDCQYYHYAIVLLQASFSDHSRTSHLFHPNVLLTIDICSAFSNIFIFQEKCIWIYDPLMQDLTGLGEANGVETDFNRFSLCILNILSLRKMRE